jgi:predicted  nucleic acid-binding Zn-ribbon protein
MECFGLKRAKQYEVFDTNMCITYRKDTDAPEGLRYPFSFEEIAGTLQSLQDKYLAYQLELRQLQPKLDAYNARFDRFTVMFRNEMLLKRMRSLRQKMDGLEETIDSYKKYLDTLLPTIPE